MQLEREAILRCNEDAFRKRDDNACEQEDETTEQQQQQQQQTANDDAANQREAPQPRTAGEEAKYVGDKRKDDEYEMRSEQRKMQNEIVEKGRRVADACREEEMRIRTMESQIREQEVRDVHASRASFHWLRVLSAERLAKPRPTKA